MIQREQRRKRRRDGATEAFWREQVAGKGGPAFGAGVFQAAGARGEFVFMPAEGKRTSLPFLSLGVGCWN